MLLVVSDTLQVPGAACVFCGTLSCADAVLAAQERRRIERAGGHVSQLRNAEGRFVGPARVFGPNGASPGLAMSRSLGDLHAHSLGVSSLPACTSHHLSPADQFLVREAALPGGT